MTKKGKSTQRNFLKKYSKNQVCVFAMAFIMLVSMAGYMVSSLVEEDETTIDQVSKASATIDFGNYSHVSEIFNITDRDTANDLFNQLGIVTLDFVETNFVVTNVATENQSAAAEGDFVWVFYVNGVINFDSPDTYTVNHGDILELRLEENPY